jgi:hypothetical protein
VIPTPEKKEAEDLEFEASIDTDTACLRKQKKKCWWLSSSSRTLS